MRRSSILAVFVTVVGCIPRVPLHEDRGPIVATDGLHLEVDGARAAGERPKVPLDVGRVYGWRVRVVTDAPTVTWREELILPGEPKTWGHGPASPDPLRHVTTMVSRVSRDGWIHHEWVVADGDPLGPYRFEISVNGGPVGTLDFDTVAASHITPGEKPAPAGMGSLDPAIIDERIKRYLTKVQYCYEERLASNSRLAGKIIVRFVIDAEGAVSMAGIKSTTMNDVAVEDCIVGRFLEMKFPNPAGGGIVTVTYPLLFKN